MCWCTPGIRTPCCRSSACHDARPDKSKPCEWCPAPTGHYLRRATLTDFQIDVLERINAPGSHEIKDATVHRHLVKLGLLSEHEEPDPDPRYTRTVFRITAEGVAALGKAVT